MITVFDVRASRTFRIGALESVADLARTTHSPARAVALRRPGDPRYRSLR